MNHDLLGLMRRRNFAKLRHHDRDRANEKEQDNADSDEDAVPLEETIVLRMVGKVLIAHEFASGGATRTWSVVRWDSGED